MKNRKELSDSINYFSGQDLGMSHGLVPSKSTVYVSNLPFSLTNCDLHKIFDKYGKIVKVTVLRDRKRRESKGVAFILFLKEECAKNCVQSCNGTQLGGRTIRANIAVDNGRSKEFIRKRTYDDKSKCYECGEEGHLSYECPLNTLGVRQRPAKKIKKSKARSDNDVNNSQMDDENYDTFSNVPTMDELPGRDQDEMDDPCIETLGAAIKAEQERMTNTCSVKVSEPRRKRIRKSTYFSDEEEFSE